MREGARCLVARHKVTGLEECVKWGSVWMYQILNAFYNNINSIVYSFKTK